jgi:hypothetical protein
LFVLRFGHPDWVDDSLPLWVSHRNLVMGAARAMATDVSSGFNGATIFAGPV